MSAGLPCVQVLLGPPVPAGRRREVPDAGTCLLPQGLVSRRERPPQEGPSPSGRPAEHAGEAGSKQQKQQGVLGDPAAAPGCPQRSAVLPPTRQAGPGPRAPLPPPPAGGQRLEKKPLARCRGKLEMPRGPDSSFLWGFMMKSSAHSCSPWWPCPSLPTKLKREPHAQGPTPTPQGQEPGLQHRGPAGHTGAATPVSLPVPGLTGHTHPPGHIVLQSRCILKTHPPLCQRRRKRVSHEDSVLSTVV